MPRKTAGQKAERGKRAVARRNEAARRRVLAVLADLGVDPKAKIGPEPTAATGSEVVVAQVGDRTFYAPEVCPIVTVQPGFELSATVKIVDGRPRFRELTVRQQGAPLSPLDLQRLPWARIAEAAVEWNATVVQGGERHRAPRQDLREQRTRARRADARRAVPSEGAARQRTAVDVDKLTEVMRLRAEARQKGLPRWDHYVAKHMNYSSAYVRKLASRANQEGIK